MLKQVGAVTIQPRHRASCGCGLMQLEHDLPHGIVEPRQCEGSLRRRRTAVVGCVPLSSLRVIKGAGHRRLYPCNTPSAKHYSCGSCGLYAHHQRGSHPDEYGYHVGWREGINPFELGEVPTRDGFHHPAERSTA